MANFAAKLHEDGERYELLFESFEESGLVENIGILLPDNSLVTKAGTIDMTGKLSFEEDAEKGEYISGIVKDSTNDKKEIVRIGVPVKADDGSVIAIIYGAIAPETLKDRYIDDAEALGAELFVLEGGSGSFIIDTMHDKPGNITELAGTSYKDGFSYNKMITDLTKGSSGYASFKSLQSDVYQYAHYDTLGFSDWRIMLIKPQSVVFAGAQSTGSYMVLTASLIILIMLAYIIFIFISERKKQKISKNASDIRKFLLEINRDPDSIYKALKNITLFAKARSSFFVDTYGEDYNYIDEALQSKLLSGEKRQYFIDTLLLYAAKQRDKHGADIKLVKITVSIELEVEFPDFYEFLKANGIETIYVVAVANNNSNTSLLGVINPKKRQTSELIKEIAVCFSMAVYNKKHLITAEAMALTDALTGVANRMAYKQDIKWMKQKFQKLLTCIYIDVNELHYYNNQHGHAAGDQMLAFIADTLKKEFYDSRLYRMGGDEFLIFTEELSADVVEERLNRANAAIEEMKYHISIGVKEKEDETDIEEFINNAEKKMYKAKAKYYQSKSVENINRVSNPNMNAIATGIKEVDDCLSVMSKRYHGVYSVSLSTDTAVQILAPSYYFNLSNKDNKFSDVMSQYIREIVSPEFHRTLFNFLQYDVLERQLKSGYAPKVSYTKVDGEKVILSIYLISERENEMADTIWIFEKEDI